MESTESLEQFAREQGYGLKLQKAVIENGEDEDEENEGSTKKPEGVKGFWKQLRWQLG